MVSALNSPDSSGRPSGVRPRSGSAPLGSGLSRAAGGGGGGRTDTGGGVVALVMATSASTSGMMRMPLDSIGALAIGVAAGISSITISSDRSSV
jgi:hypothetical protein